MTRSKNLGWGSVAGACWLALLGSGCGSAPPFGASGGKPVAMTPAMTGSALGGPLGTGSVGTDVSESPSDTGCDTASPGLVYYTDLDGDGYGTTEVLRCAGGPGLAEVGGDCDDGRREVHPGAEEVECGVDTNCDGAARDCRELLLAEAEHVLTGHAGGEVLGDLDGDGAQEIKLFRRETLADGTLLNHSLVVSGAGLHGRVDPTERALASMSRVDRGPMTSESYSTGLVERVRDINGDGFGDIYMTGVQTFLYGPLADGFSLDTENKMKPVSLSANFFAGRGDLTGDGADDLLASVAAMGGPAVALVPGPLPAGEVDVRHYSVLEIVYGGVPGRILENQWGNWFESVGDTDGDGVEEVVAADMYDNWEELNDIEYLHHFFDLDLRGRVTLDAAKVKFQGGRVAGIGDTDGDGYADVIASHGEVCPEATCVLYGPLESGDWTTSRSTHFVPSSMGTLSTPTTEVGDIDGDGRAEIVVKTFNPDHAEFPYWFSVVAGGVGEGSIGVADVERRISIGSDYVSIHSGGFGEEYPVFNGSIREPSDVDGDGLADLVISVNGSETSIFYGAELSF